VDAWGVFSHGLNGTVFRLSKNVRPTIMDDGEEGSQNPKKMSVMFYGVFLVHSTGRGASRTCHVVITMERSGVSAVLF
jgi:hypothetical protein